MKSHRVRLTEPLNGAFIYLESIETLTNVLIMGYNVYNNEVQIMEVLKWQT